MILHQIEFCTRMSKINFQIRLYKAIKSKIKFVSDKCESYFNFRGNIVVLIETDLTVYLKQYIRAVSFRFL